MNGFTIYKEYYDLITLLPEKEQGQLILVILKYMFEDIEPKLNNKQMKIFKNLKRPLDISKNNSKRATKLKTNKNQNKTELKPNYSQSSNQIKTHQDVNVIVSNYDNNYVVNVNNNLFEFIEKEFGRTFSSAELELISTWKDNELTRHAIKETVLARATSLKYTQSILESYKAKGFKTLADVEADEKKYQAKKNKNIVPSWFNEKKEESKMTPEELKEMNNLLEEFKQ